MQKHSTWCMLAVATLGLFVCSMKSGIRMNALAQVEDKQRKVLLDVIYV